MLIFVATEAAAERALFSGSFGLWLEQTATPKLVETLSKHPKFKGQRLAFANFDNGSPSTTSNAFVAAIEAHLAHHILQQGNNDIAWQNKSACRATQHAGYIIAVQSTALSATQHRIDFRILDTQESTWVSGMSLTWSGRLLSAERKALRTQTKKLDQGSTGNPLDLDNPEQIATKLATQYQCRWPHDLGGDVYFMTSSNPQLQFVMAAVEADLSRRPGVVVAGNEADAAWRVRLTTQPTDLGYTKLQLMLNQGATSGQQALATLYVSSSRSGSIASKPAKTLPPPQTTADIADATPQLLSPLRLNSRQNCRGRKACLQVDFELMDRAYVLVFRTHQGMVSYAACGASPERKASGVLQYRIKRPHDQSRIGIYAIATQERSLMRRLHRQLTATCEHNRPTQPEWLEKTLALVAQNAPAISWQAFHLNARPSGEMASLSEDP